MNKVMNIDDVNAKFEEFYARCEKLIPPAGLSSIRRAYEVARDAHNGQLRRSGDPYIMHPAAVAEIALDIGLDEASIKAALLHDVIEDTPMTYADVANEFGEEVAVLVDGVTKLTRVQYTYKEDEQMENLRKMFLAMAKDIRVILIKIADRLHNMRTSEAWSEPKRREKALETMEIYAPLAHRLGMSRVKWELEDIALRCLDPIGYKEIIDVIADRETHYSNFLDNIHDVIQAKLDEAGIKADIKGRIKHVYSIYRKMYNQNKSLDEIYDFYAVRVIVDETVDCYNVLGIVHDAYKPMPGRFKDYISTPKPNMYQSLHTTVIGREGIPFEVQIRTWDMHRTAEYGIAAHWKYKDGVASSKQTVDQKLEWVRSILEAQEGDADEFLSTLKVDMFADEVFVFTPKGDVISLPTGATPIDYAYAIHSSVGNRMTGAKVNGRIVGYDYQLKSGEIVEVLTSKVAHGPSRGWLEIVKTSEARNKIRQWFKKEARDENIAEGRARFEETLKKLGVEPSLITEDVLPQILKRVGFSSLEEMFAAIGYGGITAMRAANRVKDELKRLGKIGEKPTPPTIEEVIAKPIDSPTLPNRKAPKRTESGVVVEGIDNCLVKFARCCTPVPGDDIVGFVTRGYGVSVHRKDCQNAQSLAKDAGRWISVYWAEKPEENYVTGLEISARDRPNLLVDVMTALTTLKVTVVSINARVLSDGYDALNLVVQVSSIEELKAMMAKINNIQGVVQVVRKGYEG